MRLGGTDYYSVKLRGRPDRPSLLGDYWPEGHRHPIRGCACQRGKDACRSGSKWWSGLKNHPGLLVTATATEARTAPGYALTGETVALAAHPGSAAFRLMQGRRRQNQSPRQHGDQGQARPKQVTHAATPPRPDDRVILFKIGTLALMGFLMLPQVSFKTQSTFTTGGVNNHGAASLEISNSRCLDAAQSP